jgi:hypothetical protein
MTIRVERELDAEAWDAYASQFAAAGPFHSRAWAEGFAGERTTPLYLRLLEGSQPVGAIAGVAIEPRLAALRGIARELFFFSGPALARMDADLIRDAFLALSGYAREQGFTSLVSSARDYPYQYDWGGAKAHLQTMGEYLVDLRGSWDDVRLRMRRSIAEQTRKAGRAGVAFGEQRDASLLPQLLRLLENTRQRRQRKSGNLFSPYYLTHLDDDTLCRLSASSVARFFVARRGDEPLCVLLAFVFGRRAYALMIGSSDEGYLLRAPALLWFNTLRRLHSEGVHWLNLAGGGPQSAHVFSKVSLGAQRFACIGSVSPYLKGPVRNLLFQAHRWMERLRHRPPLEGSATSGRSRSPG